MAAGLRHALIATGDRSGQETQLLGFGLNRCGQLGTRSTNPSQQLVHSTIPGRVKRMACGREHSALITHILGDSPAVLTCGSNAHGQLGRPASDTSLGWQEIKGLRSLLEADEVPVDVKCGLDHTLVLTSRGQVLSVGWGADGQLGAGAPPPLRAYEPQIVRDLPSQGIASITTSTDFCLALARDGSLFCWGNAEHGQNMAGRPVAQIPLPVRIPQLPGNPPIAQVAAAGTLALVLTADHGHVYACGYGALGLGPDTLEALDPVHIPNLTGVRRLWASTDRCMALDFHGRLLSWGLSNSEGRLGFGASANVFEPQALSIDPASIDPDLVALGNDIVVIAMQEDEGSG
ncbi:hypothetical protein GGI07_002597 [Coemansia sp. Benny D115]|nr:hypothetical protein GGI07_002597 [Coemansia sp. Benny D115]